MLARYDMPVVLFGVNNRGQSNAPHGRNDFVPLKCQGSLLFNLNPAE
jgi:hypothetical protein